jgi:nucleoside 2-deoxyribosyltransferase
MSKIYIAGPFSKPEERESLKKMIDIVSTRYYRLDLYIPMEYKVPGDFQKLDGTWNLSNQEWARKVYENDVKHLDEAEAVFAMYVGHYCSSGTIWEVGYANGKGIPVYAYIPEWAKGENVSLMVMNSFKGYIDDNGYIHRFTDEDLAQFNQK